MASDFRYYETLENCMLQLDPQLQKQKERDEVNRVVKLDRIDQDVIFSYLSHPDSSHDDEAIHSIRMQIAYGELPNEKASTDEAASRYSNISWLQALNMGP